MVALLIDKGAIVDKACSNGMRPLHAAAVVSIINLADGTVLILS